MLGTDRLRVKLHPPKRTITMLERHDEVVLSPGGDAQAIGNRLRHDERMVTDSLEILGNPVEKHAAVVMNPAGASMNRLWGVHDLAAENGCHALNAETHAQDRHARLEQDLAADAEVASVVGMARTGREDDGVGREFEELQPG